MIRPITEAQYTIPRRTHDLQRYPNAVPSVIAPCSRPKTAVRSLAATASLTTVLSTSMFFSPEPVAKDFSPSFLSNRELDNTDRLADLEDQFARTPTDSDADDLRRHSQAQERRLRDEGPARTPQLDEVGADEEVEDAAQRYRHAENGELQRGAGVDLGTAAPLVRRPRKRGVVRAEDVASHEAEYVEDRFRPPDSPSGAGRERGLGRNGNVIRL